LKKLKASVEGPAYAGPTTAEAVINSPVGPLLIRASDRGICEISFDGGRSHKRDRFSHSRILRKALAQLKQYFAKKRTTFDLPLDFENRPRFSKAVWRRLAAIPHGQTIAYGDVAASIGRPRASRAVGQATGANPIAIVVPCHRVVGKDGSLTGFGGGMERKRWLLRHEGVLKKA
jgi:methylated-DNA-[protein]-cysteine S-methyltransferase